MTRCPHTEFRKGQKLWIAFSDGRKVVDKYIEKKSGVVILENLGRQKLNKIQSISIFRG